jgi:NTP pyrophosphatase (non-canonical NTP hydrolase)
MVDKMNLKENEILNILQEECAEVIQMVSKCRRFGMDERHLKDGGTNRERLTEEIGDVICMLKLAQDFGIVDVTEVNDAAFRKLEKLKIWSNIFKDEVNV